MILFLNIIQLLYIIFPHFRYDGTWSLEAAQKSALSGDLGLVLKDKAKHSAISSHLTKPFIFKDQAFIVQYEIMFQTGQDCGGGYIKLLSQSNSLDLNKFNDKVGKTVQQKLSVLTTCHYSFY